MESNTFKAQELISVESVYIKSFSGGDKNISLMPGVISFLFSKSFSGFLSLEFYFTSLSSSQISENINFLRVGNRNLQYPSHSINDC